ncbi:MAG: Do family serine endopeptidase, partial [Deltaproteobacteria bacterium]|nr:Do family serine endopeptidase [Deltaproteobacteria bacterium]
MQKLALNFKLFIWIGILVGGLPLALSAHELDRRDAVVEAIQKVAPAVVNINSEYQVRSRTNPFSGFGMDPFFDSFFKDFFDPGYDRRQKRSSLGSGVIIDGKRGFILTNAHVVTHAQAVSVVLKDEREFQAQIIGIDPDSDLAVLKLDSPEDLPATEMGDSSDLMIGETVIAIGNPFGFSHTVTTGVISALNRSIRTEEVVYRDFIQTDASINPGNSGGPLLNIHGDLIGINTAIYAKAQGIGFAIPINKARRIVTDLIQYGEVVLSWTGLVLQNLDEGLAYYLKVPQGKGVMVKQIESDSPATRSGIRKEDIILSMNEIPIRSMEDYHQVLKNFSVGSTIKINIQRGTQQKTVSLVTRVFPEKRAPELISRLLGISVKNLSVLNRQRHKISAQTGVMISEINPDSQLAEIGVDVGDVIRQLDDQKISDAEDFTK